MLIEQIDVIGLEPLQRSFNSLANVLAIESSHLAVFDLPSELRGDDDLVALPAQRASDQLFVLVRPVNFGRVEEIDPQLQRAIDGRQRLLLIRRPIRLAHPHAPKTLCRNDESLRSEFAFVHARNATSSPAADAAKSK